MASSKQLAVGLKGRKKDLQGSWMRYNTSINKGIKVGNGGSPGYPQILSICYSEDKVGWTKRDTGCRAHMHIKPVEKSDVNGLWEVVSLNSDHTCSNEGNKRKRQYLTRQVETMVPAVVGGYTTTKKKQGNAKQLMKIVKATAGVDIKFGQANRHIHSISHDQLHQQIGQYMWIPSIFQDIFEEDDPEGTYKVEYDVPHWDTDKNQFKRCYIAPSFTQHLWAEGAIRMIVADGTFTKGLDFKHTVLLGVTFDAENKIVVLCAAIVPVENADNWVWFQNNVRRDFEGYRILMSDADKGIMSEDFQASQEEVDAVSSRCARHLAGNCHEKCKGTMNEDHKRMIIQLAQSRTQVKYQSRLEQLREINERWADYLDDKREQFVAYEFLIKNLRRWGKVTSNGVENVNSAILPLRYEPIGYLALELTLYMQDKYRRGKARALNLEKERMLLTVYADDLNKDLCDKATKLSVSVVETTGSFVRALVGTKVNAPVTATYEVKVDTEQCIAECPCLLYNELGIHCSHVKALLMEINEDPNDINWTHEHYHADKYMECYSKELPACSTADRLTVDPAAVPPEHKKLPGRPKAAREERKSRTGKQRICKACGQPGHFTKTCTTPSTQCRFKQQEKKAIKWAAEQTEIQIDLDPNHHTISADMY